MFNNKIKNMGRPYKYPTQSILEKSIEIGVRIVRAKGPEGLTARAVSEALGCASGTLYNTYENMDALAANINIQTLERLSHRFDIATKGLRTSKSKLRALSESYLQFFHEDPQLWTLLFAHKIDYTGEDYTHAIHTAFEYLLKIFKSSQISNEQARKDAKIFWATMHGLCLLHRDGKLDVAEAETIEDLCDRLLDRY